MKNLEWIKTGLIAHRGLHTKDHAVPENSALAFRLAIEKGYGIECDVNLMKDGTIVVFHDKDLKRLCDKDGLLMELNYEDIKNLTLLDSQEKILRLEEFLTLVDGKVPLLIELKMHGQNDRMCELFMKIMDTYHGVWAMQTFHPFTVKWFHDHRPDVIRGIISEYFRDDDSLKKITKWLLKRMFFRFLNKPDFINYGIKDMPNRFLNRAMKRGTIVIAYASRSQADFDFVKQHYHNSVFEFFEPIH